MRPQLGFDAEKAGDIPAMTLRNMPQEETEG